MVFSAIKIAPRAPEAWDQTYLDTLGAIVRGTVEVVHGSSSAAPVQAADGLAANFYREVPGYPEWFVRGTIPRPTSVIRLHLFQQRAMAATLLLGVVFMLAPVLVAFLGARRGAVDGTRSPWAHSQAEALGVERFARLSVEREAALQLEQHERARAEESLRLSRDALDRSLDERIRLGRELHDNMSQTLYAVTLTLESVRRKMTAAPEIEQRLDQCMAELRRLNQEVRAHIRELGPESVRSEPLAVALSSMLHALVPESIVLDQRLDPLALSLVRPEHTAEVVNLVREAVSNSVRHARASRITMRAAHDAGAVAISVTDDGVGFSANAAEAGHGLANMRARAVAIGADLEIDSSPNRGSRIILTFRAMPS